MLTDRAPIFLLGLAAVGFAIWKLLKVGSRHPKMPPGPPTLPLIGNLHQIPFTGIEKKFRIWAAEYGGVFSLKFAGATTIVLADKEAIHDLLDKKGAIYSDRPVQYMLQLAQMDKHITFSPMSDAWRTKRKVVSHNLSPRMLDARHFKIQEAEANWLMSALLERPNAIFDEIRRYTASVASTIVFGFRATDADPFWGKVVYPLIEERSIALEPGAYPPVEQFPILKYIPSCLAIWKRRGLKARKDMIDTWTEARRRVDARRQSGTIRDCIADNQLDIYSTQGWPFSEQEFNNLLGEMMEGSADTTASQLLTLALAFALHPRVQEKAQAELDVVCGNSRPPMWSDFDRLPYINAIVKEGMRWRPTAVVPLPHQVREDDYYKGMLIPKGSTVLIGTTAVHLNDSFYPDAESFNPDRYNGYTKLANDYAGSPDWEQRDEWPFSSESFSANFWCSHHYGYGAGRRICPGMHFAERSMWRVAAKLLWAFEFSPATDPTTGQEIPLDASKYTSGMIVSPEPYKIAVKVRSEQHRECVKRELAASMEVLRNFD